MTQKQEDAIKAAKALYLELPFQVAQDVERKIKDAVEEAQVFQKQAEDIPTININAKSKRGRLVWDEKNGSTFVEDPLGDVYLAEYPERPSIENMELTEARIVKIDDKREGQFSFKDKAPELVSNYLAGKDNDIPFPSLMEEMANLHKGKSFQSKVSDWAVRCFGKEVAENKRERNHRFLEESLELVQSLGGTKEEALMLVEYVFNRKIGDPVQEVGGVMVTLAALCGANRLSMEFSGEFELARINRPEIIEKIRLKQQTKPHASPLPEEVQPVFSAKPSNDLRMTSEINRKGNDFDGVASDAVISMRVIMETTGIKHNGMFFNHPRTSSHASIIPVLHQLAEWKGYESKQNDLLRKIKSLQQELASSERKIAAWKETNNAKVMLLKKANEKIRSLEERARYTSSMSQEKYTGMKGMKHGLYKIFWTTGGSSLASVGFTHDGRNWFAPCNWTTDNNDRPMVASTNWNKVERYELLQANRYDVDAFEEGGSNE